MPSSPLSLSLIFLLLSLLPSITLSQTPAGSTSPTIAQCGTSLLPLAPCTPFVQGRAASPPPMCCGGLKQLYSQQPNCLCLLLNGTTLSSFPINTTLALELPLLCSLQMDHSTCSGVPLPPPSPPASQVSFGTNSSSTPAATPTVTVAPRPTIMGFGSSHSGANLKMEGGLIMAAVVAAAAAVTLSLWAH